MAVEVMSDSEVKTDEKETKERLVLANRVNLVNVVNPVSLVGLEFPENQHQQVSLLSIGLIDWLLTFGLVPGRPGPPGDAGICEQECKPLNKVSFFAGLSTNCNARGEAIPFDTVLTNQCEDCPGDAADGAYSADTGSFTAPMDGTYVFHVNVLLRLQILNDLVESNVVYL